MSRQFMFGTVMAAAMTVGLGAQSYPQDPKPQSTRPEQSAAGQKETGGRGPAVTLVGCLQSGDQASPTGTAGTTTPSAASATGTQFVLADATQSPTGKAETGAAGTTGTTGTLASIPSKLNLSASGSSSSSWSKYLNHKVEVKGTLEHSMSGAPSTPTDNPPSATPPANPSSSSDMGQTFRVTSIKDVADTCSGTPK